MIVIGVDVHKQSVTAVAVDAAGRVLDEKTSPVGSDELVGWAAALTSERLWAVEDYPAADTLAGAAAARPR
jgi:ribulose kinase